MIRRLKMQIIAIIMLISTALLVLGLAMIYQTTRRNLEQDSISIMRSVSLTPEQVNLPEQEEEDMRIPLFTVYRGEDGTFYAYGGQDYDLSDQNFLKILYEQVQASGGETGIIREYKLRFLKVYHPQEEYIVFSDMSFETRTLGHLMRTAFIAAGIGLAVILGLSILLADIAVRPVQRTFLAQKQFVADASHELKTPLTVILTNAEMLQSASFSEEEKKELNGNILVMSRQMKGLVEKLLQLARADRPPERGEQVNLDMGQTVEDAVMIFEPVCYENGHSIRTQIEKPVVVRGSQEQLSRLTQIFLDNAVKYADPGSAIEVILKKEHRRGAIGRLLCRQDAIMTVSNRCSDAGPSMERDAFKRFYRGDSARSMDQSYGLGLSIADAIVRRHHGRVRCRVQDGLVTMQVILQCK